MLNKLVLVVCVLAVVSHFVTSYEVKIQETTTGFIVHPIDAKNTNIPSPRLIGGEEVTPHQYPFQAALFIYKGDKTYFCGGTLITNQWVMTAAHCLKMQPDYIIVVLGLHDLTTLDPAIGQKFNTTKYKHHGGWNEYTKQNDVGLIRLSSNATLTQYVNVVTLAEGTDKYVSKQAIILGWGQTETEAQSMVLKRVTTTIITNEVCADSTSSYKELIKSTHVCTSGEGTKGGCSGDSGGPLLVDGVQAGIVSFGTANCSLGLPSVFTRITDFHDWVDKNLVDDGFDDNGGDGDNGGNDDNDDGGASTHSLLFVAIASIVMCLVRSFELI